MVLLFCRLVPGVIPLELSPDNGFIRGKRGAESGVSVSIVLTFPVRRLYLSLDADEACDPDQGFRSSL